MYAIVEIAGQQFKVEEGRKIFVHRLETEKDAIMEFDRVLLVEDGETILVGEPTIKDYIVEGKVIDQVKGDKIIVFKKKRKKGYRVRNGHRQNFTEIEITGLGLKGSIVRKEVKKKAPRKEAEPVAAEETAPAVKAPEKKAAAKKPAVRAVKKETAKAKPSKAAEKKTTEKKPAAKKTTKKK
jgi:large subunit ribosomal protein L21